MGLVELAHRTLSGSSRNFGRNARDNINMRLKLFTNPMAEAAQYLTMHSRTVPKAMSRSITYVAQAPHKAKGFANPWLVGSALVGVGVLAKKVSDERERQPRFDAKVFDRYAKDCTDKIAEGNDFAERLKISAPRYWAAKERYDVLSKWDLYWAQFLPTAAAATIAEYDLAREEYIEHAFGLNVNVGGRVFSLENLPNEERVKQLHGLLDPSHVAKVQKSETLKRYVTTSLLGKSLAKQQQERADDAVGVLDVLMVDLRKLDVAVMAARRILLPGILLPKTGAVPTAKEKNEALAAVAGAMGSVNTTCRRARHRAYQVGLKQWSEVRHLSQITLPETKITHSYVFDLTASELRKGDSLEDRLNLESLAHIESQAVDLRKCALSAKQSLTKYRDDNERIFAAEVKLALQKYRNDFDEATKP